MQILVGYNGSNPAIKALKLAQKHADVWNAKIEIIRAITRSIPLDFQYIQKLEAELEWDVRKILNADKSSYETHLFVATLSAGEQLVGFADRNTVDETIIGARKRSRSGKLIFGSTTQYVVLHAPCPVVTVK